RDPIAHLELRLRCQRFVDGNRARRRLLRLLKKEQQWYDERDDHARKLAALSWPVCDWSDENLCCQSWPDRQFLSSNRKRNRTVISRARFDRDTLPRNDGKLAEIPQHLRIFVGDTHD